MAAFSHAWVGDDTKVSDFGLSSDEVIHLGEYLGIPVNGWELIHDVAVRLRGY